MKSPYITAVIYRAFKSLSVNACRVNSNTIVKFCPYSIVTSALFLQHRQGAKGYFTSSGNPRDRRWSHWFFTWTSYLRKMPSSSGASLGWGEYQLQFQKKKNRSKAQACEGNVGKFRNLPNSSLHTATILKNPINNYCYRRSAGLICLNFNFLSLFFSKENYRVCEWKLVKILVVRR